MNVFGITLSSILASSAFASGVYPDAKQTPGDTDPRVTQETIDKTICVKGYTKTVRDVPEAVKKAVVKAYAKIPEWPPCGKGQCEIDHLISLELGGSNDPKNLWPQFYCAKGSSGCLGAAQKDRTEDALHEAVCAKKLSLRDAQGIISHDWVKCYQDLILKQPCTP